MSRSSMAVLFVLMQLFAAANALADKDCPPTPQTPDGGNDCPEPPPPPPAADLVPTITSATFGAGKVTVALSITNRGTANAGVTKTRVGLFARDGTTAINTQDIDSNGLSPSAALTRSANVPVPSGAHFKNITVCVIADALGQVQENNEGNNKVCKAPFLLAIPELPPAGVAQP